MVSAPDLSGGWEEDMDRKETSVPVELTDAEIDAVAGGAKETEGSTGVKG